ncbi:MAG: phosphoglycerate kinase, partial [Thermodesulfobacteriota bacterium]|nr:phosphoglycerate kinase [Thermodesulfobacteriota bacterium]
MLTVKDIELSGRRVFVRVDFNVPLDQSGDKSGQITDDARIRRSLPTLEYALANNAKLLIASHLGRPKGKVVPAFSLAPAAKRLGDLIGKKIILADDCIGSETERIVSSMTPGDVVMLENLRFHAGEQQNDDEFARGLASLCDVYVNDAFAVSHRANASVVAITHHVSDCVAGFLLQKELDFFDQAMTHPERPLAAVIGGAKVSSKLAALENMIRRVDMIMIGGAMANTFLKGSGIEMGQSRVEPELFDTAANVMKIATEKGIRFLLPVDVVAAPALDADAPIQVVPVNKMPKDQMALDIGPATIARYTEALSDAKTVVWNGPMGAFEIKSFAKGTEALIHCIADSDALTIVGGGDTGVAVHNSGRADDVSYISTGGGAFLTLLEGKPLPAVAAL